MTKEEIVAALEQLSSWATQTSASKGFHDKDSLPAALATRRPDFATEFVAAKDSQRLMLMVSELAEAMEELRNGHEPWEVYEGEKGKPEGVPVELADVLIRIFDFCGHYSIDIGKIVWDKMEFNDTREKMHGKKGF